MEQYELFYKSVCLGLLAVNDAGQHCYQPDPAGVAAVREEAMLPRVLEQGTGGFAAPIPFLENRLNNLRRWGLEEINYQTDWFVLRRKKEE